MEKRDCIIDKMNPFLKIVILIILTIIVSLDYKPYISGCLIVTSFFLIKLLTSLRLREVLRTVLPFILMAIGFMGVILLVRSLSGEDLKAILVVGLGFKIITISIYSTIFVKTTDPTEFTMSLIKYFRFSPKIAYAFLTAYRFLPTFKTELETIKYAHRVRGIEESRNFLVRTWNTKIYIVPMMANAVRKGVRISMAMETRAFDKYSTRTYYRSLTMNNKELVLTIIFIIYILIILILCYKNGLTSFGVMYQS